MQRIIESYDGFVPAMSVLFPLAVLVAAISGTVRSNRLRSVSPLQDPLIDALLVFALMFTGFLVFYPQPEIPDRVKLDVGDDLYTAMTAAPGNTEPWVQLGGNLVLLVPVAVLMPLRVRSLDKLAKIAIGGLLTALTVETVQFLAIPGRVASTDDVVLNTLGATIGGLLVCTPWWSAASPLPAPSHRPVEPDDTQTVWRIIEKIEHERRPTRARRGGRTNARAQVIGGMPSAAVRAGSDAGGWSAAAGSPGGSSGRLRPVSSSVAFAPRTNTAIATPATAAAAAPANRAAATATRAAAAGAAPASAPRGNPAASAPTVELPARTPGAQTPRPTRTGALSSGAGGRENGPRSAGGGDSRSSMSSGPMPSGAMSPGAVPPGAVSGAASSGNGSSGSGRQGRSGRPAAVPDRGRREPARNH